jgi:Holliday junction resolvase RusA-like endonuclease
MESLTFSCPLYPSANEYRSKYRHWAVERKAKKEYVGNAAWCVQEQVLRERRPPAWTRAHVRIVLHFPDRIRRDTANYAEAKWLLDALVKARVIADDSADVIGQPEVTIGEPDKRNPRAEVTVTPEETP